MPSAKKFKHVSYLWNDAKAAELAGDEVALLIYRSNLLGADLRLTNYGGGNTSCKAKAVDPLTGNETEIMWVKGSGGDLGTLKKSGLAALYVGRLRSLKNIYRGIEHEDEMVDLFNHCIYDLNSKAPSIDTPLHGFLPFKHIDHLHPDAAIAIAAAKDGEQITKELFGGTIGWVPWQKPGLDLGLQLQQCLDENPGIRGIMLGSHGLFTWSDTAYESYINTLEVIEQCAEYIQQNLGKKGTVFSSEKVAPLPKEERLAKAAALAPVLRGMCSSSQNMIGHFTDDDKVLQFINSNDLGRLAPLGTSCPDHFLRTKISPLVLNLATDEKLHDVKAIKEKITPLFEDYRKMYADYYETCKHPNSPAMRDANPVIIIYPGVGMFSFAKDKQTARVAAEFYANAINVMRGAEAISEYTSLPRQEAFNIEYWLLEEAKLQRMPKPKPLSGRIALITGSGGGIGKAIAKKFAQEGACVVINDINPERIDATVKEFQQSFGKDVVASVTWLADGSCFPGQLNFRNAFNNTFESLQVVYEALPVDWKMFVEYKAFEPNFYSMTVGDWSQSLLYATKLGDKAYTLVGLGHHLPNANIEQIVALLLNEKKLGGFHFNDSKYGDDDLTVGSIKPYQLFLIFKELVEGMDARGMNHAKDLGWMIDASHNIKDPLEDLLQSVEAIKIAYAQALLVDAKALADAQLNNDIVAAQEILQGAFRTDVRPLLAEARLRAGAALKPLELFRSEKVREQLIKERGEKTVATGL